jgi:hypothetical protein
MQKSGNSNRCCAVPIVRHAARRCPSQCRPERLLDVSGKRIDHSAFVITLVCPEEAAGRVCLPHSDEVRLAWCVANISPLKRSRPRRASSRFPFRATKRSSRRHVVGTMINYRSGRRVETEATVECGSPNTASPAAQFGIGAARRAMLAMRYTGTKQSPQSPRQAECMAGSTLSPPTGTTNKTRIGGIFSGRRAKVACREVGLEPQM